MASVDNPTTDAATRLWRANNRAKQALTTAAGTRTNEALWQRIVADVKKGSKGGKPGWWSARKAQIAVAIYKSAGGGYTKPKRKDNSLVVWTNEDWGYAGKEKASRYLPRAVRESAPKSLLARENRAKGNRLGERVPYIK